MTEDVHVVHTGDERPKAATEDSQFLITSRHFNNTTNYINNTKNYIIIYNIRDICKMSSNHLEQSQVKKGNPFINLWDILEPAGAPMGSQ